MARNSNIPLSSRQLELLGYVSSGFSIDQAAEKAHVAPTTAYNALSVARSKAGAKSIPQLALMAVENGWLTKGKDGSYSPSELQAA